MALSAQQLTDLRADLADEAADPAFTDDELNRLYERADSDYTRTKVLAIKQLLMNTVKFYKYVAGFTRQEPDTVFDHLKTMLELELASVNNAKIVGMALVPPPNRTTPTSG